MNTTSKITAPFSDDEVDSIAGRQGCEYLHPYTCCEGQPMDVTNDYLMCPTCGNIQEWVHAVDANWDWEVVPKFWETVFEKEKAKKPKKDRRFLIKWSTGEFRMYLWRKDERFKGGALHGRKMIGVKFGFHKPSLFINRVLGLNIILGLGFMTLYLAHELSGVSE